MSDVKTYIKNTTIYNYQNYGSILYQSDDENKSFQGVENDSTKEMLKVDKKLRSLNDNETIMIDLNEEKHLEGQKSWLMSVSNLKAFYLDH